MHHLPTFPLHKPHHSCVHETFSQISSPLPFQPLKSVERPFIRGSCILRRGSQSGSRAELELESGTFQHKSQWFLHSNFHLGGKNLVSSQRAELLSQSGNSQLFPSAVLPFRFQSGSSFCSFASLFSDFRVQRHGCEDQTFGCQFRTHTVGTVSRSHQSRCVVVTRVFPGSESGVVQKALRYFVQ